jgi:hypothetical protein
VKLTRFSCKGPYAKAWAGLLPDDLTLETFKEHFKAEFVVENQNNLMSELLEKVQKDGVGKYATEMMEYFKMLQLDEKARIRHFVRGLKFGIKETVLASLPTSLLVALRKAKEAETAYELFGKHRGPLDGINRELSQTVQRTVQEEVNLLRRRSGNDRFFSRPGNAFFARDRPQGERERERFDRGRLRYPERHGRGRGRESPLRRESPRPRNRSPIALRERSPVPRDPAQANQLNQAPPPPPHNPGRCPLCLQRGHGVSTRSNPAAVPRNDCCGWYGSHHNRCKNHPQNLAAPGRQQSQAHVLQIIGKPTNSVSVEVQSNWREVLCILRLFCTLEVNVPVQTVPLVARAEPPSKENQKKNPEKESLPLPIIDAFSDDSDDEHAYSSSDEEGEVYIRGKMGKKRKVVAREELPCGREPVSNPLTLEERIRRKETRVQRQRETCAQNLKIITLLMRGVAEKLHSHRHIKHFRSDLHRYIDFLFAEPRHRGFAHGLNEEHLSVHGLNPIASAPVPMETESLPSELPPTEKSVEDALPFANLKIDVDPKGDGTNY